VFALRQPGYRGDDGLPVHGRSHMRLLALDLIEKQADVAGV